jgi:hypothetical protein
MLCIGMIIIKFSLSPAASIPWLGIVRPGPAASVNPRPAMKFVNSYVDVVVCPIDSVVITTSSVSMFKERADGTIDGIPLF